MGTMKKSLAVLIVLGVSLASAQDVEHSRAKCDKPGNEPMIASQNGVRDTEPVGVKFSDQRKAERPGAKSIFNSVREEMNSLADRFPDLSVSWLGVSCYVRNPLRYRLAPGRTFAHQMGFNAGNWFLSVDGIQPSTLEDLKLALQCPVGSRINLFLRYSDSQYWVDVHAIGKLPWE